MPWNEDNDGEINDREGVTRQSAGLMTNQSLMDQQRTPVSVKGKPTRQDMFNDLERQIEQIESTNRESRGGAHINTNSAR